MRHNLQAKRLPYASKMPKTRNSKGREQWEHRRRTICLIDRYSYTACWCIDARKNKWFSIDRTKHGCSERSPVDGNPVKPHGANEASGYIQHPARREDTATTKWTQPWCLDRRHLSNVSSILHTFSAKTKDVAISAIARARHASLELTVTWSKGNPGRFRNGS